MGKGGNKESKKKQALPEPSEEEEVNQQEYDEDGQDIEDDDEGMLEYEDPDNEKQILQRIEQEIKQIEDPLKLTWAAVYKLKEEEKSLIEEMEKQFQKIQEKYDQLKQPILHKIAQAISGKPLQKQIYTQHELTKDLSVNKIKPAAIPVFWKTVFDSISFLSTESDGQILDHCTNVYCHLQKNGEDEQTLSVIMDFSQNDFIKNQQLKAVVTRKGEQYTIKQLTSIQFKKEQTEESSMGELFNKDITSARLYQLCQDLHRAYSNSVYFYFFEPRIDEEEQEELQAAVGNGQEQQDEDSESDIKPIKKKAGKRQKNGESAKGAVQKPQCKNQ